MASVSNVRTTKFTISRNEFIALLKAQNPNDLDVQALPVNGENCVLSATGGAAVELVRTVSGVALIKSSVV